MALLPGCTKKFRQSHTLLCTMTRHYRSYIQISFPKAIQKALSQKFSKKLHCLGSEWSQPVSVLNCYPILPHELWNKTMFAMSGVRMVIKMIYLLIKETCIDNKSGNRRLRTPNDLPADYVQLTVLLAKLRPI